MAIDLEGMENRLSVMRDRKYFIEPGIKVTTEEVATLKKMLDKYKKQYFSNCIAPFSDPQARSKKICVEVKCSSCKCTFYKEMGRGAFIEYLEKDDELCFSCLEEKNKAKIEQKKNQKEMYDKSVAEQTDEYITIYLNPDNEWVKSVPFSERYKIVFTQVLDVEKLKEAVNNMSYYDYLKTPQWKAISDKKKRQSGYKCQLCNNSGKLAVHHKTYEHKGIEMRNLNDLIVLCDDCHKKFHDIEE